jgi:predicted RNA binding protein YcfA (HicA-like mRNA interferase family)
VTGGGLPRGLAGKQIVAALEGAGWRSARIKGDHQILKHHAPRPGAYATVAVPLHREVAVGTLAGILRRIGMTADEFRELLR